MLRRLNRYANGEAAARRLDFMVFTGDIIDFCIKSDNTDPKPDFDYPSTNWERFIDLLLNQPIQGFQGYPLLNIETNEELLVPIFTILGNHDYRVGHYSITTPGIFKQFGLRLHESAMYEDLNKSAGSIISSELSSMAYYQVH